MGPWKPTTGVSDVYSAMAMTTPAHLCADSALVGREQPMIGASSKIFTAD